MSLSYHGGRKPRKHDTRHSMPARRTFCMGCYSRDFIQVSGGVFAVCQAFHLYQLTLVAVPESTPYCIIHCPGAQARVGEFL